VQINESKNHVFFVYLNVYILTFMEFLLFFILLHNYDNFYFKVVCENLSINLS